MSRSACVAAAFVGLALGCAACTGDIVNGTTRGAGGQGTGNDTTGHGGATAQGGGGGSDGGACGEPFILDDSGACPLEFSDGCNPECCPCIPAQEGAQCVGLSYDNVPCAPCPNACVVTWTCTAGMWVITSCEGGNSSTSSSGGGAGTGGVDGG